MLEIMERFFKNEHCEMILLYSGSRREAEITVLLYLQYFSMDPHLSRKTILKVVKNLRETVYEISPLRSGRQAMVQWQVKPVNVLSYALTYLKTTVTSKKLCLENPKRIRYLCIQANTPSCIFGMGY